MIFIIANHSGVRNARALLPAVQAIVREIIIKFVENVLCASEIVAIKMILYMKPQRFKSTKLFRRLRSLAGNNSFANYYFYTFQWNMNIWQSHSVKSTLLLSLSLSSSSSTTEEREEKKTKTTNNTVIIKIIFNRWPSHLCVVYLRKTMTTNV